jgi:hypothetical protein
MKSILKPLLISSALSAIGLSCTISNAFAEPSTSNVSYAVTTVNYLQALPKLSSEGLSSTLNKTQSQRFIFDSIINKPFLSFSSANIGDFTPYKSNNKNELFLMATIFNDKLQQILSMWSLKSNYQDAQRHMDLDKKEDTMSINVTAECK